MSRLRKVIPEFVDKYFNRSGTTIVETVQILAEILHGDRFEERWRRKASWGYRAIKAKRRGMGSRVSLSSELPHDTDQIKLRFSLLRNLICVLCDQECTAVVKVSSAPTALRLATGD